MEQTLSAPTPPPLKNWERPFFIVWTGQAFSLFGSSLVQFALVWWITRTTGSATLLATATLVAMLPNIFIGPFAGALVDRWNRRVVMMVADSAIALVSLGLALLFLANRAQVWMVFVIMILRSFGGAFHLPAMTASTSLMVPGKHLARVAGLNQLLQGLMSIIAPPVGALALQFLPMGSVLLIDVVTAALAVGALALVAIPQPARSGETTQPTSVWQDTVSGLRYVAGWPGMIGLIAMAMLVNFLVTPAFSLLPILVTKYFNGTAIQLGSMESAFGVGVIAGGLLLSVWGGFRKKIYTTLVGLAGMAVGIIMIGLAPASMIWLAVAGMAVAGFMNIITNGPLQALFQASVVPEMQGRVFALIGTLASLISPLSLLVAGPISDALGIRTWYWIAGSACLLAAVAARFIPAILQIEEQGKAIRAARQETPSAPPA
jgi:MFS transporter, DHA3 family, macrolide efflux protein